MSTKQKIKIVSFNILYLIIGYWSVSASILGFLLAANATKGWNVQNEDGEQFIPLGILLLLVLFVFLAVNIVCIIRYIMNRKKDKEPNKLELNILKMSPIL